MFEITEAAKDAKIAAWTPEKLRDVEAWAAREREWIHAKARPLMATGSDAVLAGAAVVIDAARVAGFAESVRLPGLGEVAAGDLHRISGWIVAEVKARNVTRWHAASEVQDDLICAEVAQMQGLDKPDWDSVSDEWPGWDRFASAYDLALAELTVTR